VDGNLGLTSASACSVHRDDKLVADEPTLAVATSRATTTSPTAYATARRTAQSSTSYQGSYAFDVSATGNMITWAYGYATEVSISAALRVVGDPNQDQHMDTSVIGEYVIDLEGRCRPCRRNLATLTIQRLSRRGHGSRS
jgi:hypothetical protein